MKTVIQKSRRTARLFAVVLTLCLILTLLPAGLAAQPAQAGARPAESTASQAAWLAAYYDLTLDKEFANMEAYTQALMMLQPAHGQRELASANPAWGVGALDAVKYAVIAANMQELALVYTPAKIDRALRSADADGIDADYAPYVACALDLGMITPAQAKMAKTNSQADVAFTCSLLMAVADVNGVSRNYLGYSDDPDIYARFINACEAFILFDDPALSVIGSEAVMQQVTTGYSLKSDAYNARFLPALTLVYGHSDVRHAVQILGLLQSEGIVAKVQFEPKVSIYQYLPEWGDPGEPTSTYAVRTINSDLMLAYATEYDMILEFSNKEDMDKLDALIVNYAKKNSGEEGKALLSGSWWQPLYYARVEMDGDYFMLYDNVITNGTYSLHPFCLEEEKANVLASFLSIDPDMDIVQVPIWCNAAFHRYLNGIAE